MSHRKARPALFRWWPRKLWVQLVLVCTVTVAVASVLYTANAFGRDLTGKAECVNSRLVGVSVEADTLASIQSGEVTWQYVATSDRKVTFTHRMPLGGSYILLIKCGKLPDGMPESENRTPQLNTDTPSVKCYNLTSVDGHTVAGTCGD